MHLKPSGLLGLAAIVAGCAAPSRPPAPSLLADATVEVVTARAAGGGHGPQGIAYRFTTHGDQLISKREVEFDIHKSPFNFFSNVLPIDLGPGTGRYEVYADGRLLASKSFEVVAPATQRLSQAR